MKKYLFIFIALVLFSFGLQAAPAHAAITFVQSKGNGGNGTNGITGNTGVAFSSNVTAGDAIYASLYDNNNANDTLSFSDSQGNSWTNATTTSLNGDGDTMAVACAMVGSTGADTVKFTVNGSGSLQSGNLVIYEVKGTTCGVDQLASLDNQTATTTCSTPQITTTNANDLLLTSCGLENSGAYSAGTGWSHLQDSSSTATHNSEGLEMQTSTATGNFTGKMTTTGTAGEQLGIIVAYASSTPVISGISASPSVTTAIVTWTTSVTGDSLINFGTSTTYTNSSTYSSNYVTSHLVTLTGLTASTTYHYQVVSSDGFVATSSDETFTTPSSGVAQSVAGIVSPYGGTSATATFGSNVSANDVVWVAVYDEAFTGSITYSLSGCGITWTQEGIDPTNGYGSWYGTMPSTGSCAVTATVASGTNGGDFYINAVDMQGVQAVIDGHGGPTYSNAAQAGATVHTPSITTTQNGDLVIGSWLLVGDNGAGTVTANPPYTLITGSPTTNVLGGISYLVKGSAGNTSSSFNNTSPSIYGTEVETTAFEPTGVGPGTLVAGSGNILVVDYTNNRLEEFSATGTYEGQIGCASGACTAGSGNGEFSAPYDVTIDSSGNVWMSDTGNERVEEFSAAGTYESQFGSYGSGNGEFNFPSGIAIDARGNVWVGDYFNDRVQEFSATGTYESQFGSGGSGNGELSGPEGITIDSAGNIWVADAGNNRVEEFSAAGTYESQFGSSGSGNGEFTNVSKIAFSSNGNIWAGDLYGNRVEEFSATGTYENQATGCFSGAGCFDIAAGVAIDSNGNIWATSAGGADVFEFSATGTYEGYIGSSGSGNGELNAPQGIAITGTAGGGGAPTSSVNILVTDDTQNRVQEFSATGTYEGQIGCASGACSAGSSSGELNYPYLGMTTDSSGNIWVPDAGNNRVQEFSPTGAPENQFGSYGTGAGQFVGLDGVAVDSSGNVWAVDDSDRVEEFSPTGSFEGQIGCVGSSTCAPGQGGNGQFRSPGGMFIDSSGNIWVADSCNSRVQEFSATGTYEGQFGTNGNGPKEFSTCGVNGVVLDSSGNIWVTDSGNNRVQEFSATDTYEGQIGCSGSGYCSPGSGPDEFSGPAAIAIDGNGNLWVTDTGNNRVEEFSATGTYEFQFGSFGSANGEFGTNGPTGITIVGSILGSGGGTNISASSTQHWAWNDEAGWIDFYDTRNIIVSSAKLTGYASSSIGDISLDCGTSPGGNICGTSNYGVSNDGSGNLAGWAWNDGYGWISFCGNSSGGGSTLSGSNWICPTSPTYQVVINPTTGVFSGWAWNDTLGWISFNCLNTSSCGTSQYDVVTTWTETGVEATGTLDSETFDTGVTSGAQINSVTWQGSAPSSTAVGFQFAVASSSSGPWNFVGPDGTAATNYSGVAGVPISLTDYPVLDGRYFRYRVILSTNSSGSATPTVTGVQVNWSK